MKTFTRGVINALILLLTFTLINCHQEDDLNDSTQIKDEKSLYQVNTLNISKIPAVIDFLGNTMNSKFTSKNTVLDDAIFEENVLEVIDTLNNTNYTFKFAYSDTPQGEFYNLIVGKTPDGENKTPYVLKYVCDDAYLDNFIAQEFNFNYFKGNVSVHKYTDFFELGSFSRTGPCPPTLDENDEPVSCMTDGVSGNDSGGGSNGDDSTNTDSTEGDDGDTANYNDDESNDTGGSGNDDSGGGGASHSDCITTECVEWNGIGQCTASLIVIRHTCLQANRIQGKSNNSSYDPGSEDCAECPDGSDGGVGILSDITAAQILINKLGTLISLKESAWLSSIENEDEAAMLTDFLIEYNETNAAKSEAALTVTLLASKVPWVSSIGNFNNLPSLSYTHTRTVYKNGVPLSQYKLTNGDIISEGDYGIWQDSTHKVYYYSQVMNLWYEIPNPTNYNPLTLDFLWDGFWNSVLTGVRYCTPIEDIVILIDGKDFEGVEQSRATAGAFLLVELIPGAAAVKALKLIKYGDEVIQAAEIVTKIADDFYKTQKNTIKNVLEGVLDLDAFGNTIRKGNFGEMVTDTDLYSKGYEPKHVRRTNIDQPLDQGIDGVFQNPNTGEYIIVESKYNTGSLSNTADGLQMSDSWITGSNRLIQEVGEDLANEILDDGYTRVLAKISTDGSISYRELNNLGQEIGDWTP